MLNLKKNVRFYHVLMIIVTHLLLESDAKFCAQSTANKCIFIFIVIKKGCAVKNKTETEMLTEIKSIAE